MPSVNFALVYILQIILHNYIKVILVLDFTKIVLEVGRVACFILVEIRRKDADHLEYAFFDYMLKDGKETAAFVATALMVCLTSCAPLKSTCAHKARTNSAFM